MKKIVITGITGELSRAILLHISRCFSGVEVVGIARNIDPNLCFDGLILNQHSLDLSKCDKIGSPSQFKELCEAIENADILIHTAAIKRITDCEESPLQAIQTNILGTQNLIDASKESGVRQIINISSDMSVEPLGAYGATKLLQSKLIIDAFKKESMRTCNIRLGNIFTKNGGTIFHFFTSKYKQTGVMPVTNDRMSRFGEIDERVAELILELAEKSLGGEIYVPKFKSYDILNVVAAVSEDAKIEIVGMRQGEKLSEIMVSQNECQYVVESENYYVVIPSVEMKNGYRIHHNAKDVPSDFSLTSQNSPNRYTISELRAIMKEIGIV